MSEQSSDFDDNELRKCAEDTNNADAVPPIRKPKTRGRKFTPGARRIQHAWKHEEVVTLIAAVEKRRGLWDVGSDEYKLSKLGSWREVCEELACKIDPKEVKLKWSSLRVSFKVNLANYHKKTAQQGADESCTVPWRYFQQMLFLKANGVSQSPGRRSTMKLSSAVADRSVSMKKFALPPTERTTFPVAADTRLKHPNVTATPTPSVSPAPSSDLSAPAMLNKVADPTERNSAFCNHLLAELNALSEGRALDLRRGLNQTLWNFLDSDQDQQVNQLIGNVRQFAPPVLEHINNTDAADVKMNIF